MSAVQDGSSRSWGSHLHLREEVASLLSKHCGVTTMKACTSMRARTHTQLKYKGHEEREPLMLLWLFSPHTRVRGDSDNRVFIRHKRVKSAERTFCLLFLVPLPCFLCSLYVHFPLLSFSFCPTSQPIKVSCEHPVLGTTALSTTKREHPTCKTGSCQLDGVFLQTRRGEKSSTNPTSQ